MSKMAIYELTIEGDKVFISGLTEEGVFSYDPFTSEGVFLLEGTVYLEVSDSGSGSETLELEVSVPVSDDSSGMDQFGEIALTTTDAGTFTEQLLADKEFAISDVCNSDDFSNVQGLVSLVDELNSQEQTLLSAYLVALDSAIALDSLEVTSYVSCTDIVNAFENVGDIYIEGATDSCIATDETSIQLEATVSDSGKGVSITDVTVTLKAFDSIIDIDIVNINALLPAHDLAVGLDLAKSGYYHKENKTVMIGLKARSASISFKNRP